MKLSKSQKNLDTVRKPFIMSGLLHVIHVTFDMHTFGDI